MPQRDKQTTLLLKASKALIDQGNREAARHVLQSLDDPQANAWLQKLGQPQQSPSLSFSRFIWSGLFVALLISLFVGFGIGRMSVSSAPQSELEQLAEIINDDMLTITAEVQQVETQQAIVQVTNSYVSDISQQTRTAVAITATQGSIMTEQARATWRAGQTATQSARGN